MSRVRRLAWFNVIVLILTILVSGAAVIWLAACGSPVALSGLGSLGLGLLHLLGPVVFPKKSEPGKVLFDERDAEIARRAESSGDLATGAVFLSVFFGAWLALGLDGLVPVSSLGVVIAMAYVISKLTESVTALVLYGRETGHVKE
jgi:hypothetical protein